MCHGDTTRQADRDRGEDVPLTGGFRWDIPPGTFYARNITPDPETGIGSFADRAIARALRHGVGPRRTRAAAVHGAAGARRRRPGPPSSRICARSRRCTTRCPAHRYNLLGKRGEGDRARQSGRSRAIPPAAHEPARRDPRERSLPRGVGGAVLGVPHAAEPGDRAADRAALRRRDRVRWSTRTIAYTWSPPNLTSDPETGRTGRMTEDEFVARFRAGRVIPGSPMPWQALGRMEEDDLRGDLPLSEVAAAGEERRRTRPGRGEEEELSGATRPPAGIRTGVGVAPIEGHALVGPLHERLGFPHVLAGCR